MTAPALAALRSCAAGLHPLEAGIGPLTAHDMFLHRSDYADRFIRHGISITDGTTPMAQIDWDTAITALDDVVQRIEQVLQQVPGDHGAAVAHWDPGLPETEAGISPDDHAGMPCAELAQAP